MQANTPLISQLKKKTHEAILNTTVHGIPNIFKANQKFSSVYWSILLIVSLGSCAYFIARNVSDYYAYDVITNINILYESKPEFPKITICHTALAYGFIQICIFNNKACRGEFDVFKISDYCYAINLGINRTGHSIQTWKSLEPGSSQGLKLQLFNLQPLSESNKFAVYINNHSDVVNPSKAIIVGSGMITSLVIGRERTQRLGEPYRNCKKDHTFKFELAGTTITKTLPYYQHSCFKLCRYQEVAIRCNLTQDFEEISKYFYINYFYFEYNFALLTEKCSGLKAIEIEVDLKFKQQGEYEICSKYCVLECESTTYSIKTFYQTYETLSPYISVLNIYYEDYRYISKTEIPKIFPIDFFGIIGGLLGLFLGISLFSFLEIFEFVANLVQIIFRYHSR